jgi:hypothetical protein
MWSDLQQKKTKKGMPSSYSTSAVADVCGSCTHCCPFEGVASTSRTVQRFTQHGGDDFSKGTHAGCTTTRVLLARTGTPAAASREAHTTCLVLWVCDSRCESSSLN